MKTGILLMFTFLFGSCTAQSIDTMQVNSNGFAVLELFTSEGCSSCPPADALLARIQAQAGNKPIYLLAYHVDYWNHLGWKDNFSNPLFSKRQYQYSEQLRAQVYTPQLVINGQSECIGSDETAVSSGIQAALAGNSGVSLQLQGQLQSGKMNVRYHVTGKTNNAQLLLAIVQKHAVSHVKRGENEGRTLSHIQIVNDLQTYHLKSDQGTLTISLPESYNATEWEIIGMVQDQRTGAIRAANRIQ